MRRKSKVHFADMHPGAACMKMSRRLVHPDLQVCDPVPEGVPCVLLDAPAAALACRRHSSSCWRLQPVSWLGPQQLRKRLRGVGGRLGPRPLDPHPSQPLAAP